MIFATILTGKEGSGKGLLVDQMTHKCDVLTISHTEYINSPFAFSSLAGKEADYIIIEGFIPTPKALEKVVEMLASDTMIINVKCLSPVIIHTPKIILVVDSRYEIALDDHDRRFLVVNTSLTNEF